MMSVHFYYLIIIIRFTIFMLITSFTMGVMQASFFIAYVVTSGWTSTSSELFRIFPLLWSLIKRPFTDSRDTELEVPGIPYHSHTPRILFFVLLGITYFFLAPLILPFLLVYLCLGYIIYRNQVSRLSMLIIFNLKIIIWKYHLLSEIRIFWKNY